ncbi:hypothetical protein RRF57_004065 [Xylaria bambusicola]|uniref:Uncharacterized protein n=1 Tax=Xylaria bambusicola TaxID=326684 RepID=A0AAN7U9K3_9PEZI
MRSQLVPALLGFGITAISTVAASDIIQDGPFALHVKGQAKNSSIDGKIYLSLYSSAANLFEGELTITPIIGYVHFVDLGRFFPIEPIQYEPMATPPVGNITYEFYFNYTEAMATDEQVLGWLVTDSTYANPLDPGGAFGKAMSLHSTADSNVAFGVIGAGTAAFLTFDSGNKTFISLDFTDSAFVPNVRPTIGKERVNLSIKRSLNYVLLVPALTVMQITGRSAGNSSTISIYRRYHGSHMDHLIIRHANVSIS